jgi:phosphotriesterase-related protein
MNNGKCSVHTVKGPIPPEQLGKTMTHEHLLWDQTCYARNEPEELSFREFIHQKVCIENLGKIFYNAHLNLDNIRQYNTDLAIEEVMHFRKAGGNTIVDATSIGIGRDPEALLAISEATGINVVMGSGFYIAPSHSPQLKSMNRIQIADFIISEFVNGVKNTGIKPGIIGEIGISDLSDEHEMNVLKASATVQKETGAPLFIHPPFRLCGHELLDIVENEGGDISRVVLCHCDPREDSTEYFNSIAKRGAYIECDQFGLEFPMDLEGRTYWLPRDIDRIRFIKKMIDLGNSEKILVSQDVCFKTSLVKFGGWGYGHILRDLVRYMKEEGIDEASLNLMLVENPKRILSF